MVALELQVDLAEEIRQLAAGMTFKNPTGGYTELNVFEQNLPMRQIKKVEPTEEDAELDEDDEDEELQENFPYIIVRLDSGKSESAEAAHVIKTVLIAGIFDDSLKADGHKTILNLFEKIRERFRKNPVLKDRYEAGDEMTWALPDEDEETFPYFFGAMYMEWITAEFRREDPLA